MKILIPSNIFTAIFALSLPSKYQESVSAIPSSTIGTEISSGNAGIGFIPSLDLINHKDLFVSSKIGISFDGYLSNSYIFFKPDQNKFDEILLRGDVSINEVILSKILFSEKYDSQVEVKLDTTEAEFDKHNYIVCGNENFESNFINNGLSFSDEIAEMIDFPYTNYLLVSKEKELLQNFVAGISNLDNKIEDNLETYLTKISFGNEVDNFILSNLNSVYYELTENEITGLKELLHLPYFHGIIEDIIDVNFI